MPRLSRHAPACAIAFAAAGAAMSLLGLAQTLLGPVPPFLFAFVAVAVVAVAAGPWAAFGTGLLCLVWLALPWLPPGADWQGRSPVAPMALFVAGTAVIAWVVGRVRVAGPQAGAADGTPSERGLVLLMLLSALLPMAVYVGAATWTYRAAFDEAAVRLDRAARIAQEHATKVLDLNEALVGRITDLLGTVPDEALRAREAELHARLKTMTQGLPQVQSVWVHDATGRPLLTNRFFPAPRARLDVSDRDFFRWHRDGKGGLYISEPGVGKVSGQPFFDTSRRRSHADGSFGGLVSVSLFPAYFADFYAELARDEAGLALTLLRRDGTLLARHPQPADGLARRTRPQGELMRRVAAGQAQGTLSMPSSFDGRERLVAFRVLDRYDVLIGAGVEHEVILAGWQRDMVTLAALLFPMSAALVGAAWVALRRARRERQAVARLEQEVEQRVRAEKALVQAQKLDALAQLTGSVAHDFNNLLAVVNNNAYLIERRPPGSDARPQAEAIRRAVDTGAQLTRRLLAFTRRQPVKPAAIELADLLPRALDLVRTTMGPRVEVDLDLEPDLPPVLADPAELELAILNLGLNARDAMPDGGQLAIRATRASAEPGGRGAGWVRVSVGDTGTGIERELLERVFEPFFTTKPEGKGAGLGLPQVRAACEQVGGRVEIASTPGRGTEVTLVLPAAARQAPGAAAPPAAAPRLDCELLLVEDNAELAQTTASLLQSFGARVARAANADAALRLLAEGRRFDLVVSDIVMPGACNGLALARELRRREPPLTTILLTGYASEAAAAVADGFAVLPKPCTPEQLVAQIGQALAAREPVLR